MATSLKRHKILQVLIENPQGLYANEFWRLGVRCWFSSIYYELDRLVDDGLVIEQFESAPHGLPRVRHFVSPQGRHAFVFGLLL